MKNTCVVSLKRMLFVVGITGAMLTVSAQDQCKVVGWATQNGGVSGGGSAAPTVVSNYNDFKSALTGSAKVVQVSGTITIPGGGRVTIQDQTGKTIIGLPGSKMVSTDMTKDGSGIMYIKRCKNFIMRNLVFEGPGAYDVDGYDNFCIDNCQNFWVDHCEFHDGMDGNFDIKNMSDLVSVTWCTFSYEKPPKAGGSGGSDDHRYTNLIGSSDGATGDEGHLNVTFNYCWWGNGCRERMPRMRYGKLHMVNNLFSSSVSNHCIRAGYKANILAVGNYFDNQKKPVDEYNGDYTAIRAYNNSGASDITKNSAFTPPYMLEVASPASIINPIKSCAGAKLVSANGCSSCGGPVNKPPAVTITGPTDNATFDAPATVTLTAMATDEDGSIAKVEFFNGTTLLGSDNSSPYSWSWASIAAGTYTVTAKATDNGGAAVTSDAVKIVVIDPTLPALSATDNTTQTVNSGTAMVPMVFTWGGAATDVTNTALPAGVTSTKNSAEKKLTISGTPTKDGTFSVTTVGGSPAVTLEAAILIKIPGVVLADWYKFQDATLPLEFVSFTDASVETDYFDESKPANGVAYTPGALRLNTGTGTMKITLRSLETLKFRWYATGGRTLKITYGPTGTEHTWNSSSQYESGAHEFDLTAMIPELVSSSPITVTIINDRTDGGSLNIHDLYVKGSEIPSTAAFHAAAAMRHQPAASVSSTPDALLLSGTFQRGNLPAAITVVNLLGKTVMTREFSAVVDISKLESGIYFLRAGVWSGRFIKR
jgi:pectate lyase